MAKKFVSVEKLSKKAKKAYYNEQRSTWGVANPATKVVESKKAYNRKKQKQSDRKEFPNDCFFVISY
ncbi:MAG: hypothetical protein Q4C42_00005 [Clostridia bacterium]|nr:hypothetical protein [Clostridia bacterium]